MRRKAKGEGGLIRSVFSVSRSVFRVPCSEFRVMEWEIGFLRTISHTPTVLLVALPLWWHDYSAKKSKWEGDKRILRRRVSGRATRGFCVLLVALPLWWHDYSAKKSKWEGDKRILHGRVSGRATRGFCVLLVTLPRWRYNYSAKKSRWEGDERMKFWILNVSVSLNYITIKLLTNCNSLLFILILFLYTKDDNQLKKKL